MLSDLITKLSRLLAEYHFEAALLVCLVEILQSKVYFLYALRLITVKPLILASRPLGVRARGLGLSLSRIVLMRLRCKQARKEGRWLSGI